MDIANRRHRVFGVSPVDLGPEITRSRKIARVYRIQNPRINHDPFADQVPFVASVDGFDITTDICTLDNRKADSGISPAAIAIAGFFIAPKNTRFGYALLYTLGISGSPGVYIGVV